MDEIRTTAESRPQRKIERRSGYEALRPEGSGTWKIEEVAGQIAIEKIRQVLCPFAYRTSISGR
jgi:hypothetical protein